MYDSVTGQVIEQRTNDHHYHITYNNTDNNGDQHQQPHDVSTQMHVIEQESYEVCDETTDSDLELLMMMQPHDANNSIQNHTIQHHQQMTEGVIQIGDDEEEEEQEIRAATASNMAPILHIRERSEGQLKNDVDESVSEFLQSNERRFTSFHSSNLPYIIKQI